MAGGQQVLNDHGVFIAICDFRLWLVDSKYCMTTVFSLPSVSCYYGRCTASIG